MDLFLWCQCGAHFCFALPKEKRKARLDIPRKGLSMINGARQCGSLELGHLIGCLLLSQCTASLSKTQGGKTTGTTSYGSPFRKIAGRKYTKVEPVKSSEKSCDRNFFFS